MIIKHRNRLAFELRNLSKVVLLICIFNLNPLFAADEALTCIDSHRYTFSWSLDKACGDLMPRGGTSKGAPLVLDPEAHSGWLSLQEEGLSVYEKDRRAILAMAGPYRTSFEFIEIVGYTPGFKADPPYQSWGTEYIYVVDDRDDFISLQHIMVMFVDMGGDDGIVGPIVQKHWRQDWQYEKSDLFSYIGSNTWEHQQYSAEQVAGTWAQSVFQVDDSPRYESFGKWEHKTNFSSWISGDTLRPVPRRESSFRKGYDILQGTNRHTIVPTGWVHEELNYKVKLNDKGEIAGATPYLSKEIGVNRYDRIIDFDFTAGDEYWENTGLYWSDVRTVWNSLFDSQDQMTIQTSYEGTPLFGVLFDLAEKYNDPSEYKTSEVQEELHAALSNYLD